MILQKIQVQAQSLIQHVLRDHMTITLRATVEKVSYHNILLSYDMKLCFGSFEQM
jgi:hypothetical protein